MPDSRAQVRAAHAVLEGKSDLFSKDFANEVVSKMHGRKMSSLPDRASSYKNTSGDGMARDRRGFGFRKKKIMNALP